MEFDLSEEHVIFRDTIRNFAEKEIAPLVEEAEKSETFPVHLFMILGDLVLLCVCYP